MIFKNYAMNTKKIFQILGFITLTSLISLEGWSQDKKGPKNINYTSFTVSTKQNKVMLNWTTDNAVSTNYFEIQKSSDGVNYKTIALVMGPDPKQPGCDCYGCFEKLSGKNVKQSYYRLKHINADGTGQLSETRLLAKT
jgi:hypothetical protein